MKRIGMEIIPKSGNAAEFKQKNPSIFYFFERDVCWCVCTVCVVFGRVLVLVCYIPRVHDVLLLVPALCQQSVCVRSWRLIPTGVIV